MINYRISKYNPWFRVNGIYTKEEWTSIGDVGKCFDGKRFTFDEYIAIENNYVVFVDRIIQLTKTDLLKITGLEDDSHNCQYENGHILRKEEVSSVVRGCLREEYWCRLVASSLEISFGYDYYVYAKCSLNYFQMMDMASDLELFVENNPKE